MSTLDQQKEQEELNRFREMLNGYWAIVFERADYIREPNIADVKMEQLYRGFGPNARRLCNIVLPEWLESTDASLRFAAFALIREFRITSAIPALRKFTQSHANPGNAPGRAELEKATQVLEQCIAAESEEQRDQEHAGD